MSIATEITSYKNELKAIYKRLNNFGIETTLNKNLQNVNAMLDAVNTGVYRPVEYIESSGTQYIDTGFKFTDANFEVYITATPLSGSGVFGANGTTSSKGSQFLWSAASGNGYARNYTWIYGGALIGYNTKHTITFKPNSNSLVIDGTTVTHTSAPISAALYNVTLFAYTNGTSLAYSSSKIYSFKIYVAGVLKYNFVPCVLTATTTLTQDGSTHNAGEAGMWDTVSNKFYFNKGTGKFTAPIPSAYLQTINYIHNPSTAVIQSSIPANTIYRIDTKGMLTTTSTSGYGCITGVWKSGNQNLYLQYVQSTNNLCFHSGASGASVNLAASRNTDYTIVWNISGNTLTVNGAAVSHTTAFALSQHAINMPVFAGYVTSSIQQNWIGRVYYLKFYGASNVLLADMIPVKTIGMLPSYLDSQGIARASGVYGMWDKITNKFYTTTTSVAFTGA